jgi:hypothetical protein
MQPISRAALSQTRGKLFLSQSVFDVKNELLIPQGSVLRGKVLQASPAGRWGRNGLLRFNFSEISLPSGFRQAVEGVPTAIAASSGSRLQVDQEGRVSQESNHSLMAPLVLGLLATSAITSDESTLANTSASSNGICYYRAGACDRDQVPLRRRKHRPGRNQPLRVHSLAGTREKRAFQRRYRSAVGGIS